jgi:hypothetical protein
LGNEYLWNMEKLKKKLSEISNIRGHLKNSYTHKMIPCAALYLVFAEVMTIPDFFQEFLKKKIKKFQNFKVLSMRSYEVLQHAQNMHTFDQNFRF